MQDFKLPGMMHARVIRPPAIGAKLVAVDESSIKDLPGARVVRINDFLAVKPTRNGRRYAPPARSVRNGPSGPGSPRRIN
jgi:hypothetical protein